MALTEESIDRIVAGMMELARTIEARLGTVARLAEARRLMAELEAAQWAGTPDALDAKRLPFVFARMGMDRMLASGLSPKPRQMMVLGEPWPIELEVAATDAERAAVQARKREIGAAVIALGQARLEPVLRLTPPPSGFPTREEIVRRATTIRPEDPEAREWLRSNPGHAPLAANAFDADDARAFVDSLYAAGAVRVVIASENIRDEDPPYCDALRVQLPADPAARAAVLALTNAQAESEGFDPADDTGQEVVFLWWD
jgi:hypothetical protein